MGHKVGAAVHQGHLRRQSGHLQPGGQPLAHTSLRALLLRDQKGPCLTDRHLDQLWDKGRQLIQLYNLRLDALGFQQLRGFQYFVDFFQTRDVWQILRNTVAMSMLRLQKRLASSILHRGKKKVWLDPNETKEIDNINSCHQIRPKMV